MRRKHLHVGACHDTFDERLRTGRCAEGEIGQYIPLHHGLCTVGAPSQADIWGWTIDNLGVPRFEWRDDLGANFLLNGVSTAFSASGTGQTNGEPSPWITHHGQATTCTRFVDNGHYRYTTAPIDPTPGDDFVAVILANNLNSASSARYLLSTRGSGQIGWTIQIVTGNIIRGTTLVAGPTTINSNAAAASVGWNLIVFRLSQSASRQYLHVNGAPADNDAASGDTNGGYGIGLNGSPAGAQDSANLISRALVWYGVGVADLVDDAWCARLARVALGIRESYARQATFTRTSWSGLPLPAGATTSGIGGSRAGVARGLFLEPGRENKVWNNQNPNATTGWTAVGGGVISVLDDWTNLAAAGIRAAGPCVIQFANATGVTRIIRNNAQTGNTNQHSVSVYGRIIAGAGARIGLCDISAGTFTDLGALTSGYARTVVHGAVPANNDDAFAIQVPNGCTVGLAWAQLEESPRASAPIPVITTAATYTRTQDTLTTAEDPPDLAGRVELTIEPYNWSGNEMGTVGMMYLSGSGNPALWVEGGTWRARIDGTTNLDSGVAPADGVGHRIILSWQTDGQQSIEIWNGGAYLGGAASIYDGTLYSAGTWQLAAQASVFVRDFAVGRNP